MTDKDQRARKLQSRMGMLLADSVSQTMWGTCIAIIEFSSTHPVVVPIIPHSLSLAKRAAITG